MKNFKTWSQESLADFASDAFKRIKEQDDAIEQLRKDLSDAMKLLRELNRQENEFVSCAEKFVKNEWVCLTDKEVDECLRGLPTQTIDVYARRIETKIKDKNNG
jgi:hypothetical protein